MTTASDILDTANRTNGIGFNGQTSYLNFCTQQAQNATPTGVFINDLLGPGYIYVFADLSSLLFNTLTNRVSLGGGSAFPGSGDDYLLIPR